MSMKINDLMETSPRFTSIFNNKCNMVRKKWQHKYINVTFEFTVITWKLIYYIQGKNYDSATKRF